MEFYKKGGTFVEGETSTDKKTILIVQLRYLSCILLFPGNYGYAVVYDAVYR